MSDNSIEVLVVAPRVNGAINSSTLPPWLGVWINLSTSLRGEEYVSGPYSANIVDYTSPNHPRKMIVVNAINNFSEAFDALGEKLALYPDNMEINIGYAYNLTVGALKAKIASLQFQVIDKAFSGPGYGGANYNGRIEIRYDVFASYTSRFSWPNYYGANFLFLHKIAHNTELGIASRSWMLNSYRDSGSNGFYGAGNPYFERQEAIVNAIAKRIADALGIIITDPNDLLFPPFGFDPLM